MNEDKQASESTDELSNDQVHDRDNTLEQESANAKKASGLGLFWLALLVLILGVGYVYFDELRARFAPGMSRFDRADETRPPAVTAPAVSLNTPTLPAPTTALHEDEALRPTANELPTSSGSSEPLSAEHATGDSASSAAQAEDDMSTAETTAATELSSAADDLGTPAAAPTYSEPETQPHDSEKDTAAADEATGTHAEIAHAPASAATAGSSASPRVAELPPHLRDFDPAAMNAEISRLDAAGKAITSALEKLHATLAGVAPAAALDELRTHLAAVETQVAAALKPAAAGPNPQFVALDAVVNMAAQRLELEQDVAGAVATLRFAAARAAALDTPETAELEAQIEADISALEALSLPNVAALAEKLAAAQATVDQLKTRPVAAEIVARDGQERHGNDINNKLRGIVGSMWQDVLSLVEVKDATLSDRLIFDPKLRYFLVQNLRLELASARLAALQRDSENFRASADLVLRELENYFDPADARVAALANTFTTAIAQNLAPDMPSLGSVDIANALLHVHKASQQSAP